MFVVGAGPTGLIMANVLDGQDLGFRIIDKNDAPVEESRALVAHVKTLELPTDTWPTEVRPRTRKVSGHTSTGCSWVVGDASGRT